MAGEQQQPQQQQPEPPEAPPARLSEPGVGALLKASRLRLGQDLHDIADILRIRYVYMEAIEDGRYDALPGPTYASGFIRAYAEHLGLDSEEVVRRFKAEGTAGRETANLAFPEPIPETGIPGGAVVLVGIVIAVVAYGAWYVNTTSDGFLVELVSPIPERLASLVEGEGKPPGETAPPSAAGKPEAKPAPKPEPDQEAKPEAKPEPAAGAPQPAAAPATSDTAAATPAAEPPAGDGIPAPVAGAEIKPEAEKKPAPATVAAPAEPAPAQTASRADASTEPPTAAPLPETRDTPVATPRAPEPAANVEPVIAPGNVPVDLIPAPRPATPAATTASATPAAPQPAVAPPEASPRQAPSSPALASAKPPAEPRPVAAPTITATAPATTATAPAGGEPARILVRAKTNSWIQVRDESAGEMLVTRLLRTGDSYAVPNRPGLRLSTGNAGALEILVDGAVVPAIGDDGAVRRNVLLDAEKLKAGQAVAD